jgi:DNA-binding FrmR family transcriptional regulator
MVVALTFHLLWFANPTPGGYTASLKIPPWGTRCQPKRGEEEVAQQTRGYSASKDQLLDRLRRIEGQVRGVANMVEQDRYCIEVVTQINAVRAALDKVALGLVDGHVRHCLVGGHGGPTDPQEQASELMGAVGRMLSR